MGSLHEAISTSGGWENGILPSMTLIIFGMVLPWLLVGAGCWLVYQFIRQYGQILLRLESLEAKLSQFAPSAPQLAPPAPSLALGSAAPEFELPDLAGGRQSLAQLRGRKVLLIFFNPGCGYCVKMVPDLGALPVDGKDGHPLPVVVTTGRAEAVRKLIEEHRVRCPVLLQEQTEIAERYQAHGRQHFLLLVHIVWQLGGHRHGGRGRVLLLPLGGPRAGP